MQQVLQLYKASYTGHSKEIWTLAAITFVNRVGTMVVPFLSVYLTSGLGFSLADAGILAGSFGVGSLGGTFIGGKLSDRIGPNRVIMFSLAFGGLFLIALQYAHQFHELMLLIMLTALFGEAYRPAVMASIGNYVKKAEMGRAMALIRMSINLGFSAAPFIGGFMAENLGYPWLFWTDGLTCLLAAIYVWQSLGKWERRAAPTKQEGPSANGHRLHPHEHKGFLMLLAITVIMGFVFVQWFHTVPVFMKQEMGLGEQYIGLALAFNGILIVLIELPAIHWVETKGRIYQAMSLGLAFMLFSYVPLLLENWWWSLFAMLLITLGEILYFPLNVSTAINMSPPGMRGNYMGWYSMAWSVIHILAPSLGLYMAEKLGFSLLWGILTALLALCIVLHWMRKKLPE